MSGKPPSGVHRGVAALVLAAGSSRRLGQPKQLVAHGDSSLLRHAASCAVHAGCKPVVVVLGSRAGLLVGELEGLPVQVVVHRGWRHGLSSSIRAGVASLQTGWPHVTGLLLLVCDQPLITSTLLRRLRQEFDGSPARIVACSYAGTVGVPALFGRAYFDELLALDGDRGAKPLLVRHAQQLHEVQWPQGAVDIDTPENAAGRSKK